MQQEVSADTLALTCHLAYICIKFDEEEYSCEALASLQPELPAQTLLKRLPPILQTAPQIRPHPKNCPSVLTFTNTATIYETFFRCLLLGWTLHVQYRVPRTIFWAWRWNHIIKKKHNSEKCTHDTARFILGKHRKRGWFSLCCASEIRNLAAEETFLCNILYTTMWFHLVLDRSTDCNCVLIFL